MVDKILHIGAELAARRQLIGKTAAIDARQIRAARDPGDRGALLGFGEGHKIEQRVGRRVAGANDNDASPGLDCTVTLQNIRAAVGDAISKHGLALSGKAAGA